MKRGVALVISLAGLTALAGCPDDPHSAKTWTSKLGGREHERALKELEQLGDPTAISDLGEIWRAQGRQPQELDVIIGLASPLTPEEAKAKFRTDFEQTGRPASWKEAMPFLSEALVKVDDANPRSVEGATKAAEAIGLAHVATNEVTCPNDSEGKPIPCSLDALIHMAHRDVSKNLFKAQIASIKAMGKFENEKTKAAAELVKLIERPAPQHPRTEKDKKKLKVIEETYSFYLAISGAAINALGELHIKTASKTLLVSLYKTPELFEQVRRALVATGPTARDELLSILRGKNKDIEDLFSETSKKSLRWYCGDKGDAPPDQCQPVSAKDYYASTILGDFYDPETVDELLSVLDRPPLPAYYMDEVPATCYVGSLAMPCTQQFAVMDALRKIGSPKATQRVRSMWMVNAPKAAAPGKPKPGAPAGAAPPPASADSATITRILAIGVYPFVTRDEIGIKELGDIAGDNGGQDDLRREAATAFARMSRSSRDIAILEGLAQKYFDAATKKRAEADGEPKKKFDAAEKQYKADQEIRDKAKQHVQDIARDKTKTAADIKEAAAEAKKAEEVFKTVAKKKHREGIAQYKGLDGTAKAYRGFARMFQQHVARIEVGIRCNKEKDPTKCYANTLSLKPEDSVKNLRPFIKDLDTGEKRLDGLNKELASAGSEEAKKAIQKKIDDYMKSGEPWTKEEKLGLWEGEIERAMLEVGKKGSASSEYTNLLLDNVKSDDRLVRQSILLALPKIAKVPCDNCEAKIAAAIKSGEGKVTLAGLQLETTMLRNYFMYAGGRTPQVEKTPDQK